MNKTLCNNCARTIIRSLQWHYTFKGLDFCSEECAEFFDSPDNCDPDAGKPIGLAYDLGMDGVCD